MSDLSRPQWQQLFKSLSACCCWLIKPRRTLSAVLGATRTIQPAVCQELPNFIRGITYGWVMAVMKTFKFEVTVHFKHAYDNDEYR